MSNWGSASSIKVISSNHFKVRRLIQSQGEESDESDRVILVRDDVTINHRDKVVIGSDAYIVHQVKTIDPIEDITIAKRIILMKDERYVV